MAQEGESVSSIQKSSIQIIAPVHAYIASGKIAFLLPLCCGLETQSAQKSFWSSSKYDKPMSSLHPLQILELSPSIFPTEPETQRAKSTLLNKYLQHPRKTTEDQSSTPPRPRYIMHHCQTKRSLKRLSSVLLTSAYQFPVQGRKKDM